MRLFYDVDESLKLLRSNHSQNTSALNATSEVQPVQKFQLPVTEPPAFFTHCRIAVILKVK
jgi:hypothetical protein